MSSTSGRNSCGHMADVQADADPVADATSASCSHCALLKPLRAFSRNQLTKGPTKQRCKECTAVEAVVKHCVDTAATELSHKVATVDLSPHEPVAMQSGLRECQECRFMGIGRTDEPSGCFYCCYCWSAYDRRRWPVIGGSSVRFKELTAQMSEVSFGNGEQRIELMDLSSITPARCASLCDELRRSGEWSSPLGGRRVVLGFDTETRPCFHKGEHHPICLIQLATPRLARAQEHRSL